MRRCIWICPERQSAADTEERCGLTEAQLQAACFVNSFCRHTVQLHDLTWCLKNVV